MGIICTNVHGHTVIGIRSKGSIMSMTGDSEYRYVVLDSPENVVRAYGVTVEDVTKFS